MKLTGILPGLSEPFARVFNVLPALAPQRARTIAAHRADDGKASGDPLSEELAARIDKQLILPIARESDEETSRAAVQDYGQFLARQDRWEELSALIHDVDLTRRATACATSHAELLSYGARADVIHATEDALLDGKSPSLDGIEALEEILMEHPTDYAIAVIVALAHIDIGWAWRGQGWAHTLPEKNLRLFEAHFERADDILGLFDHIEARAPLLLAARCALMGGQAMSKERLADAYERLIALDPGNPRPLRTMGHHLLPRWHGAYDLLELEARRATSLTSRTWGQGGYFWSFMDALAIDPGAARVLDLDYFLDGMRDILERHPTQYFANLMAAYAAITMDPARTAPNAPDIQRNTRAAIFESLDWILSHYLYELHPMVWAQAAVTSESATPLPIRKANMRRGVLAARRAVARHFASDLLDGTTVAFSKHGLRLFPLGHAATE
ncbi:hypothetical protein [Rhodalgimonas zhirmunskyi]|uniref:DUF4034 domain-containing protein n=1 Tax=Rhodalgimonas zhirmunskyi TaxID=2964767 RepID=A0AAJ1UFZ5_9RHOB|nr:hypothetical protein [Rhodoalgimonas zhirmunskyi]MDQ2095427.1 hypothetical protein [Rhodoalgimonas zhirmunskyi]